MSKTSFKLCYVLMVIILLIACSNFICISCSVQRIASQSNQTLNHIDTLLAQNNTLSEDENNTIDHEVGEIKESMNTMNLLQKGIFDSNTITFLASFLLIFLGGILFDIEKRAKKTVTQSQKVIEQLDIELDQLSIYKLTSYLTVLTKYLSFQFSVSNYKMSNPIPMIVHEIHTNLISVKSLLNSPKIKYMTKNAIIENRSRLREAKLILEKEEIDRKENKGKLNPILDTRRILDDCLSALDQREQSLDND